jgi:ribosomal protein S6--L-glutamate ligase
MRDMAEPVRLGWEEWVALPALGLPALRAKVDTGARTSALHAFDIEPFGPPHALHVRFTVEPVPGRPEVRVTCAAPVIDRRLVTSSNGESEHRFVIETELGLGDRRWPIEVSLTDRSAMTARMLLGRQALGDGATVSATEAFLHPPLDYAAYRASRTLAMVPARTLRIAVLSRERDSYSTRRLVEEGSARGHVVEVIDTARCYMAITPAASEVHCDGARLPHYDAVVPRIGASVTAYGAAVLRQFQARGTFLVNGPEGIVASRDKLQAHQTLARHRIPMPATAFASSPEDTANLVALAGGVPLVVKLLASTQGKGVVLAETPAAAASVISAFRDLKADFLVQRFVAEAGGADIRCLVVDGRVVAAMRRRAAAGEFRSNLHQGGSAEPVRISPEEREIALRAARAFRLRLAGVDLLRAADGPKVLEVNSSPGLRGIETATGRNVAAALYAAVERHLRPLPVRRRRG